MKKYLLFFLAFVVISCSDSFLELSPKDQANTADFYKNASDFEVALIGAYGSLMGGGFSDLLVILGDVRSDNATAIATNGTLQRLSEFNMDATAGEVSLFYRSSYVAIQAANAIIGRVAGQSFKQEDKNRIEGEARFIRALTYFYLVNVYGDVPLILEETSGSNLEDVRKLARVPKAEVYAQIVADLKEAEAKLPAFNTPNRASALAAKSLLGKVYVFQGNYAEAVIKLKEVVNSSKFKLLPKYGDLYRIGNARNSESIFVIQHVGGPNGTGSGIGFRNAPRGTFLGTFRINNQGIYVEPGLYRAYSQKDTERQSFSAQKFYSPKDEVGSDTVYYTKKYLDNNPFEASNASNTIYVIRYADVLLLLAEASNELGYIAGGEAFTYFNLVRVRAGITPLSENDLPSQQKFRDGVLLERRLELAMEGHRWFDLVRTGRAIETLNSAPLLVKVNIGQNDLLYPIPQSEILNNPDVIKQNPGY